MNRPLILLSARGDQTGSGRRLYDNESYFTYVSDNGGLPVLAGIVDEASAAELAASCSGLLITGGEDVDPARYHETNTFSELIDADLEDSDLLLYRAFRKAGKPILGICRGIQIINVAEGGTLIQDIHADDRSRVEHEQHLRVPPVPRDQGAHLDRFCKGSRLHSIFGDAYAVNSFHHQAVKELGTGFTATAFSEDGLIEGIEKENVTAVQWHPERMIHDAPHQELMKRFVRDCLDQRSNPLRSSTI